MKKLNAWFDKVIMHENFDTVCLVVLTSIVPALFGVCVMLETLNK